MYYNIVRYIKIQFSVLNSCIARYTITKGMCTVSIHFQYYSTTFTFVVYCIQSAGCSLLYNTDEHYFTLHSLYCRHYTRKIHKYISFKNWAGPC